jgi:multidrug transporter EmrE-like cation transporter
MLYIWTALKGARMRGWRIGVLILGNLAFTVLAKIGFKLSAASSNWRGFWFWQIAGNLAGFIGVLTLTWLLRFIPLHVAYPVTMGLAVIGVQVVAAQCLFRESIGLLQWAGTGLVTAGIVLISVRR